MRAEIITIGDEILIGDTIDSNSAWIATKLNALGIDINKIASIADRKSDIVEALVAAEKKADLIIITGGLGPTNDDITKLTLCEYFDTELVLNKDVLQDVENFLGSLEIKVTESNVKQAEVPANCKVLRNSIGTAPGLWFEKDQKIIISLPGVPHEMKTLMQKEILPSIEKINNTGSVIKHKSIVTTGIPESHLAEKLSDWEKQLPEIVKLAYLPSSGINRIRLSLYGNDEAECDRIIKEEVAKLEQIIPEAIVGYDNKTLEGVIGDLLRSKKMTMSTAESCSGGNIAHLITSIAGCSDYYQGSVVAYSNSVKANVLNIDSAIIDQYGAVSKEVVEGMATGAQNLFKTDYAVSTSGIAGPSGARPGKPVGTVWIAVASPQKVISKMFLFGTDRSLNIRRTTITALNMLREMILDYK